MSTTLSDLRSQVRDWLQTDSTRLPDARLNAIINEAQRRICRTYDLYFLEVEETLSTVASTESYALSAFTNSFSRPINLWYIDPTTGDVTQMDEIADRPSWVRKYKATDVQAGAPAEYNIFAGSIYFGPTPNAVYTIYCDFLKYLADLSADGDNNDLTNKAPELLLYKSLLTATEFSFEDARIPLWQGEFNAALSELLGEHSRLRTAGRRTRTQEPG